jgi:hypothetical protein
MTRFHIADNAKILFFKCQQQKLKSKIVFNPFNAVGFQVWVVVVIC